MLNQTKYRISRKGVYLSAYILLLSFLFSSCNKGLIYEENFEINGEWNSENELIFKPFIPDTLIQYDINLVLEISKEEYPFSNLYLEHQLQVPGQSIQTDTLNINLISRSGLWNGDCSKEHCLIQSSLASAVKFTKVGEHKISLKQFTRVDTLSGIYKVGLEINKTKD